MDLRQLVRAFDGGRIDADTLVWRKGMPDWRRLRDVPELAERLMGPEAAAKAPPSEAPLGAGTHADQQEQSPPVQNRAERSRTPPANYSVDDRAQAADTRLSAPERKDATPSSEAAATLPGASGVPHTPPGGYGSPEPPRARPVDRRSTPAATPAGRADGSGFGAVQAAPRLAPGAPMISAKSGSTQMGLSAAGLPSAPAEQRTITQTGLAPAGEASARAHLGSSALDAAADERASEADGEGSRVNAVAPSPSPRNPRSPTPAPGARRRPSSDETPAQKPASISVSSSALAQASARPRAKHLAALGVLVLGAGVVMVRGTLSSDASMSVPGAASEPAASVAPSELPRIEKSAPLPLEPEPKPTPPQLAAPTAPPTPPSVVPAKAAPADSTAPGPTRLARIPGPPVATAPAVPAPSKPSPAPAPAVSAARLDIHPSLPEAPANPSAEAPVTRRAEIAAPAVPPPATVTAPAATTPAVAPPAPPRASAPSPPAATPPAATPPAATPPAATPPAATPPTTTPAVFDEKRAREQMGLAAFKASTCNQLGGTRGSGQVNVVIQSWGRVVRVTHLNQAFVGTPVGLCIMEAFQQVQVPPFEGGPRTLVGSFLVE